MADNGPQFELRDMLTGNKAVARFRGSGPRDLLDCSNRGRASRFARGNTHIVLESAFRSATGRNARSSRSGRATFPALPARALTAPLRTPDSGQPKAARQLGGPPGRRESFDGALTREA